MMKKTRSWRVRWHYRTPLLAWLLPPSYALHILEEWFGGFPDWIAVFVGSPLPRTTFIIINATAMLAMIVATRASTARDEYGWAGIAVATILFVNALTHAFGSLVTQSYSPGLITAVVFYLPIAGLVLLQASSQAPRRTLSRGVAIGIAVHAAVFVWAYMAAR